MASGVEVVGIILGVVPIVTQCVGAYAAGIEDGKKIFTKKGHDGVKLRTWDDLFIQLQSTRRFLARLIESLPTVGNRRREEVIEEITKNGWQSHADVVSATKSYLGHEYQNFEYGMDRLYSCLGTIFADDSICLNGTMQNDLSFLSNLKAFRQAADAKQTQSSFKDRLKTWSKEKWYKEQINELSKWRQFVQDIVEKTPSASQSSTINTQAPSCRRPSRIVLTLSKALHKVLSEKWSCVNNCLGSHTAKICLNVTTQNAALLHRAEDPESIVYSLLAINPVPPTIASASWKEFVVEMHSYAKRAQVQNRPGGSTQLEKFENVCCSIVEHETNAIGGNMRLVANHYDDDNSVVLEHGFDYSSSRFTFSSTSSPVHLDQHNLPRLSRELDLLQKRSLALAIAYGCMTLGGSSWLPDRWSKEHILFFHSPNNEICHTEPMLLSEMKTQSASVAARMSRYLLHSLPSILSLGIVLLELETGAPIESKRTPADLKNGVVHENTDCLVAMREVKTANILTPDYREAILACLDSQRLVPHGQQASMDEEVVRRKIYERVIQRLEADCSSASSRP